MTVPQPLSLSLSLSIYIYIYIQLYLQTNLCVCVFVYGRLCGLVATDPKVRVRFPALPNFLSSSGSGTESTQPVSTTEELLRRKSSGSGLESREYGSRDPSR
jgi:hypothetical protein